MAEVNLGNDTELNVSLNEQTNLSTTVYDINYIPDYVKAEQERRANETIRIANEETRQENEEDRIALYEDLENKRDTDYWRGSTGATPSINATASISGGTGTPGVIVTKTGTDEEPNLSFAFTNLKGDKGDKGDPGAIKFLIVQSLPSTGAGDTIYLVPITPDTSENNYEEYIYVNGSWELLGRIGVHVDLTGYETISDARNDYAHTLTMSYTSATKSVNVGIANYNGSVLDSGAIELSNLATTDSVDTLNDYVFGEESVFGEGTSLQLTDTLKGKLKSVECKGNTSQDGTPTPSSPIPVNVVSGDNTIEICGKNVLNPSNFIATTKIPSIDNSTSVIDINVNSSSAFVTIFDNLNLQAGNYTFWCEVLSGTYTGGNLCYYDKNGTKYASEFNFRLWTSRLHQFNATNGIKQLRIYAPSCTSNVKLRLWVVKGTYTSQTMPTYEPYIGNTYPIYLGVENLWSNQTTGWIPTSGAYPTTNSTYPNARYVLIKLNKGESITLSNSTSENGRTRYIDTTTNQVVGAVSLLENEYYTTTTAGITQFSPGTITAKKEVIIAILDIQGNVNDLVVNYGKNVQYISNNPIELCKIGTYQDRIYKENGKWYLHKEIGKVVLNGSENFSGYAFGNYYRYSIGISALGITPKSNQIMYSNYFNYNVSAMDSSACDPGMFYYNETYSNVYFITTETTANNFKSWLSSNNMTCYYILATPTNTLIEDTTLIEQLEALSSEKGITNIGQENNDLPMILDVEAFKNNLNGKLGLLDILVKE